MRSFKDLVPAGPAKFSRISLFDEENTAGIVSGKDEPTNRFCCQSSYLRDNGVPSSSRILRPNISLGTRQRNATNERENRDETTERE